MNTLPALLLMAVLLPRWNHESSAPGDVRIHLDMPEWTRFADSATHVPILLLPGDEAVCMVVRLGGLPVGEAAAPPDLLELGMRPLILPVDWQTTSQWSLIGESANYQEISEDAPLRVTLASLDVDGPLWPRRGTGEPVEGLTVAEMCVSGRSDEPVNVWVTVGVPARALQALPFPGMADAEGPEALVVFSTPILFGTRPDREPKVSLDRQDMRELSARFERARRRGDAVESLKWADIKLSLFPDSDASRAVRGQCLETLGRKQEALAEYRKALQMCEAGPDCAFPDDCPMSWKLKVAELESELAPQALERPVKATSTP